MGVSSLGAGSSILTQDVIDQLKAADNAKFVAPIDAKISAENKKQMAFETTQAGVDSVYESLKSVNEYGVFEGRTTSLSKDDVVDVTAAEGSDIQDFTLDVTQIATKEIVQSGQFDTKDSKIADGDGTMELSVGDKTFSIDYNASTSLDDLKDLINDKAGDSVSATIIQVADGDYRLMLSSAETGTDQAISISDSDDGSLVDQLKPDEDSDDDIDGMTNVQEGVDAKFKFNGLEITRSSNNVDDLLTGVKITLKDVGRTEVNVEQDRARIEDRITNFIDKYNSMMYQLGVDTKSSQDDEERGVYSSDTTMKNMKSDFMNIIPSVGGDAGRLQEFGIEVDREGRLSLNSKLLNEKLDENPENVHSYFIGGTYTQDDGSTIELKGAFASLENKFADYSKGGKILDNYSDSINTRLDSLSAQREKAVERLDNSYEIMQKKFASYDLMISQYNKTSDMFIQMMNADNND